MKHVVPVLLLGMVLAGCNQGVERLEEKAGIEGRASAEAQIKTENENLAKKANEMESDLATRHRFYQAVKGTYEGILDTEQGQFRIRLNLVPSLPPYQVGRTRALDEIVSDLNNLYFNAQVVQWNPANNLSAVGCRIENVRPDIRAGEIYISSENCPNFYSIRLADKDDASLIDTQLSGRLATDVIDGKLSSVGFVQGQVQPSTNAAIYSFVAKKVSQ